MVAINISALQNGDRRTLAKAITLVESRVPEHQAQAHQLMSQLTNNKKNTHHAMRIGISGAPGVGKSTFIEAFGTQLTQQGLTVAVLAIDPSSPVTGGSILGDKTRMANLAKDRNAFIRPTPSSCELGGVTQTTRAALLLCEAAQFDVIIVETVGAGQSEIDVTHLTDLLVVLMQPDSGDSLQGIKKGIIEVADFLIINKADGARRQAADMTRQEFLTALQLTHTARLNPSRLRNNRESSVQVMCCSSLEGEGLENIWQGMHDHWHQLQAAGQWDCRRQQQGAKWLQRLVQEQLPWRMTQAPGGRALIDQLQMQVQTGALTVEAAVEKIFAYLLSH